MPSSTSTSGGGGGVIMNTFKLVFIGDAGVGKSTLLNSYRKGEFHDNDKEPVLVLEGFTKSIFVRGKEHLCLLWDTIGSTDFETLRPLSYPKTDCFVICFAINDRISFDNLKTTWIPEIQTHSPKVPYIFVGTKTDIKTENDEVIISKDDINAFIATTDGLDYLECSSKDLSSVENILKSAVQAVIQNDEKLKAIKDANSSQSFCMIC